MNSPDPITRLNAALEGRYTIESELGEGGMATVYLAEDLKHERKVALKVLKPELAAVVGADRFLAEIKTTANLNHPHILPLFDSGEADSFLFYVMPHLEGESLRDRLERETQLPVKDAVRIATAVAHALDHAHRNGVIHRDIKPANILLQDGEPVVADFGIALAVGAAGGGRLTETGLSVGTPHYMSPEQATGDQHVGPATDVYALGCVLYEALVGEPPFTGGSAQAVLGKIITTEPPSATAQRRAVPANVDAVIKRALEKLPADRFSGAQGFAHALTVPGFRHGEPTEAVLPARRQGLALGAMGLAAGVFLGWVVLGSESTQFEFGDVRKVTFDPGIELMPAISPDGQDVAYVSSMSTADASQVVVRSLGAGRPVGVSDEPLGSEEYPRWTSDGASISFHSGGRVYEVAARGGTPRPVAQLGQGAVASDGAWSADGSRFAYVRTDEMGSHIYASTGDGDVSLANVDGTANTLRWSPDGRWIAYAEGNPTWVRLGNQFGNVAPSAIKVVPSDGGDPVEVATMQYLNVSPAFLPDGRLLFVSGRGGVRDIYVIRLRRDGSPDGAPTRVTAGLNPHSISVSADGRRLAFGTLERRQNVYSITIPASGPVSGYAGSALTAGQQVTEGLAVSPEGNWLAFDSDRGGTQDVYRRRLEGGESLQLTTALSDEFVRSWSRDGTMIAGHGFNEGIRDIFVMDPDGLSFEFIAPHPAQDRYPDFSPDGRRIAFDRSGAGQRGVLVMERDSAGRWGDAVQVAPGRAPRWSPDGRLIASIADDAVWLTPSSGGEPELLFRDTQDGVVESVEWYDAGRRLLVQRRFSGSTSGIWSISVSGGRIEELIRFDDPARPTRQEIAAHEGQLYYTLGEFEADIWLMELVWR